VRGARYVLLSVSKTEAVLPENFPILRDSNGYGWNALFNHFLLDECSYRSEIRILRDGIGRVSILSNGQRTKKK
jgi:hypothetical protein